MRITGNKLQRPAMGGPRRCRRSQLSAWRSHLDEEAGPACEQSRVHRELAARGRAEDGLADGAEDDAALEDRRRQRQQDGGVRRLIRRQLQPCMRGSAHGGRGGLDRRGPLAACGHVGGPCVVVTRSAR